MKKYSNKELAAAATKVMKAHKCEVVYMTCDGQAFTEESAAKTHARNSDIKIHRFPEVSADNSDDNVAIELQSQLTEVKASLQATETENVSLKSDKAQLQEDLENVKIECDEAQKITTETFEKYQEDFDKQNKDLAKANDVLQKENAKLKADLVIARKK